MLAGRFDMAHLVKSETKSSDKNRWATTWECFERAHELFGMKFSIDVCAEYETAKCTRYYGPNGYNPPKFSVRYVGLVATDALRLRWGDRFWCNPPFDLKKEFITQAIKMSRRGKSGMMLLPYEPCTKWFRELVMPNTSIVYVPDGRYNFLESDGVTKKTGVNFPSCFVLFTPHYNGGRARIIDIER